MKLRCILLPVLWQGLRPPTGASGRHQVVGRSSTGKLETGCIEDVACCKALTVARGVSMSFLLVLEPN